MEQNRKHNNQLLSIHSQYTNRAYNIRNDYKQIFQWVKRQLTKCQKKYTQFDCIEWSKHIQIVQQQQLIIQSMLLQLSVLIKKQCKQKGQLFQTLFQHTIRTLNRLKSHYERAICNISKQQLQDEKKLLEKYQGQIVALNKQNSQLKKQKQHKWRNLYMIIKDNRVLRRQKGKLLRKNRQQVWRSKILQEDLIYYKKENQKKKLLIDHYYGEQDIQKFIQNQITLNKLQRKLQTYPQKARKLLKHQLIELEINELKGFDKKIQTIIKALEDNQIYDDYDDWEQNIEPVKLLYNISTQTQQPSTQQVSTNTPIVVPKHYQSLKTQTKVAQLQHNFKLCQKEFDILIMDPCIRKKSEIKNRNNNYLLKTTESRFSSKFGRKSSIESLNRKSNTVQKSRAVNLKVQLVINEKIRPRYPPIVNNQKQIYNIEDRFPLQSKRNTKKYMTKKKIISSQFSNSSSRKYLNYIAHKQITQSLDYYYNIYQISITSNSIGNNISNLNNNLNINLNNNISNTKNYKLNEEKQKIYQKQNQKFRPKINKFRNSLYPNLQLSSKRNQLKSSERSSKQMNISHKRQFTDQIRVQTEEQGNIKKKYGQIKNKDQIISRDSKLSINSIRNNHQKKNSLGNLTFSNFNHYQQSSSNHHKKKKISNLALLQSVNDAAISDRFLISNLQKILVSISKRKKQIRQNKPTFYQFLVNHYLTIYNNQNTAQIYLNKFISALRNFHQILPLQKYNQNCFVFFNKLLDLSKNYTNTFQTDMFTIVIKTFDKCQQLGIKLSISNIDNVPSQYGLILIQYISSVYLSLEQIQKFMAKFKFTQQKQISIWKFIYCLHFQLCKIIESSQTYTFLQNFIENLETIKWQQIHQILYILNSKSTQNSILTHNLQQYMNNGQIPIHRLIFYAHRYSWNSLLQIKSCHNILWEDYNFDKKFEDTTIQDIFSDKKWCEKFPWLFSRLRLSKVKNGMINQQLQGDKIVMKFCKMTMYEYQVSLCLQGSLLQQIQKLFCWVKAQNI